MGIFHYMVLFGCMIGSAVPIDRARETNNVAQRFAHDQMVLNITTTIMSSISTGDV